MDGLFLKAAAGLVTSPITVSDVRTNATGKSFAPPWGFTFKYPLRSLWPRGGGTRFALGAIATDDTVLVEDEEKLVDQESGNWVFKILRFRSFRKDECENGDVEGLEVEEKKDDDRRSDGCCDQDECSVCDNDDDGKKIEMDKKLFLEMLRRVTLAEAKLYAQMSYLGSLAYSIPQIKVPPSPSLFYLKS